VPEVIEVTTPVADPIVAILPLLLVQVPPAVVQLNVDVPPTHTDAEPVMDAAIGLTDTVTIALLLHPEEAVPTTVYVVVMVGLAVTVAQVLQDSPADGVHK
jgi:hypothetical protein